MLRQGGMKESAEDIRLAKITALFFIKVRTGKNISQEKFAELLDVNVRYLQDIEYGEKVPSSVTLFQCLKLADDAHWAELRSRVCAEAKPKLAPQLPQPASLPSLPQPEPSPA